MKIISLNLPRDLSQDALSELFSKYGEIESCSLVMDNKTGESKGFGFIEMKNDTEAQKAISELHGTKIGKNKIRVKIAEEKTEDKQS